ncbi:mitochondrial amidoxime reducing component 2 [Phtheirospermum japonicum]|uniref:Mitochondrial amidoxime reducing component 2 n=1 Tax=Phtheirospermum japonicum TaxID=374723 RepID=A0A830BAU2_9LAMI|nr:mitochondrial amidoxime reducing component 2 [Phtheirospermum japonicum]
MNQSLRGIRYIHIYQKNMGSVATVKSIFVYPIKSCRGISLPQAPISSTGFRWDRQWLVVNSKGRAITQRLEPKLALVQVELPNQAFSADWEPNQRSYLVIRAPGMDVLKVPLMSKSAEKVEGVSVWEWSGSAVDEGAAAAQWFSNYLGKPCRFVRFNDGIDECLERSSQGTSPCEPLQTQVPTINQEKAVGGSEPTETLKSFRSDIILRPTQKKPQGKVYFGQNMVCNDSLSEEGKGKSIKVGDPVFVLNMVSSAADAAA